jgi:MFS family permease
VVVKPSTGWLSDRLPRPLVAGSAMLVTGGGLGLLLVAPTAGVVAVALLCYAVGQRAFPAPMQAYLMDVLPEDSRGGDIGATRTLYKGVGALGPASVGFVASTTSYVVAYAGVAVAFLGAGGLVLWIERS